jgi:hypothetical protein
MDMDEIDKITLELLMNKSQYNKYLSVKDPSKYEEVQQHLDKVAKHRNRIMQITDEYCENQNTQNSIELDEAFSNYLKSCIRFIEMKQFEEEPEYEKEKEKEDTIFEIKHTQSFWGKGAIKKKM